MAKINELKTDSKKCNDGVWKTYSMGIKLKIARLHNSAYNECLRKLQQPYLTQIRAGVIEPETMSNLVKQAVAKHILLDWENIEDDKGQPIPYSSEKALEFFKDPELRDLYTFVLEQADISENYRKAVFEESAKN